MPYQIHIFIVKACQCSRRLVMKWYGPIWHWSYYMIISTEPNILKLGFPHFADVNMEFTLVRRSLLHTLSDFEIRNIGSALSLSYSATLLVYGNLYGNKTWTVPLHPRVAVTLLTSRSVALYGNQTWWLQVAVPLRTSRSVSQNQVPRADRKSVV